MEKVPILCTENKEKVPVFVARMKYKQKGEVDYLIDDYENLTVLPIEIKSGKDYKIHSALDRFLKTTDYHIRKAVVLSNAREVSEEEGVMYLPIYYCMFYERDKRTDESELIIPEITL